MIPSNNVYGLTNNCALEEGNINDKVYAFLSRTIYDELIEYGIDQEYILTLSLYFHTSVIKEYFVSEDIHQPTIFESISKHYNMEFNESHNDVEHAVYNENLEVFCSIYDDVINNNPSPELS